MKYQSFQFKSLISCVSYTMVVTLLEPPPRRTRWAAPSKFGQFPWKFGQFSYGHKVGDQFTYRINDKMDPHFFIQNSAMARVNDQFGAFIEWGSIWSLIFNVNWSSTLWPRRSYGSNGYCRRSGLVVTPELLSLAPTPLPVFQLKNQDPPAVGIVLLHVHADFHRNPPLLATTFVP